MRYKSTILSKRELTQSTFVLRFERNNLEFTPGQYLVVYISGSPYCREYSIYSAADKPYLEILVKEVKGGTFTQTLKHLKIDDIIEFEGPFGFFVLPNTNIFSFNYLFVATGTGISPFNSIINTFKLSNYNLLHGVRYKNEAYEKENYNPLNYKLCATVDNDGQFHGRVTTWLRHNRIEINKLCYLCGNADMIDEASDILESYGIPPENIKSEVFF